MSYYIRLQNVECTVLNRVKNKCCRANVTSKENKNIYPHGIVNIMAPDDLVMQGARASAAMILTKFICNISMLD